MQSFIKTEMRRDEVKKATRREESKVKFCVAFFPIFLIREKKRRPIKRCAGTVKKHQQAKAARKSCATTGIRPINDQ